MYHDRPNHLFAGENDCLAALEQAAITKVRSEPDEAILDADPDWLVSAVVASNSAEPVTLDEAGATRDEPEEVTVDVSGDPRHGLFPGEARSVHHQKMVPVSAAEPAVFWRNREPRVTTRTPVLQTSLEASLDGNDNVLLSQRAQHFGRPVLWPIHLERYWETIQTYLDRHIQSVADRSGLQIWTPAIACTR